MNNKEFNLAMKILHGAAEDAVLEARRALADRNVTHENRARLQGQAEGLLTALSLIDGSPYPIAGAASAAELWEGCKATEAVG